MKSLHLEACRRIAKHCSTTFANHCVELIAPHQDFYQSFRTQQVNKLLRTNKDLVPKIDTIFKMASK
jgi:hypothetical protein